MSFPPFRNWPRLAPPLFRPLGLTGQRIPTLYTIEKVDRHILKEQQYPTPVAINPTVPEQLSRMVMGCVRYRPTERPADMQEVLDVLEIFRAPAQ